MFAKNKRPLLVILIFSFWIVYTGFTAFQFFNQAAKQTEQLLSVRQANLDYVLQSSVNSLLQEHPDGLQDELSQARKLGLIDFYILQKGSDPIFFENNSGRITDLNHNYVNFNTLIETEKLKFKTIKILDFRLTAGFTADKSEIVLLTLKNLLPLLLKDIGIVTLLLGLVAFSILRDIMDLSRTLSSRSRSELSLIRARSREAETLLKGAISLDQEATRLKNVSEIFGATVGPALRHELDSQSPPPYAFKATLCRIDLNGYTQILFRNNAAYLNQILNAYFARAREIIGRYHGLIYQFVGDEIVFEFKDDMALSAKSPALATACIRDLFREAQVLESRLPETANHYFKLKASLAYGEMNFVCLDQGHALTGLPLIESVRLLSLIDEKDHQLLAFFEEAYGEIDQLCSVLHSRKNHLKGFKEESHICLSRDFAPLADVFADRRWHLLTYFRSDEALIFIFDQLGQMAAKAVVESDLINILMAMKRHRTQEVEAKVAEGCAATLLIFKKAESEGKLTAKVLASLIGLISRVIPQSEVQGELSRVLKALLDHGNFRVQANAMVALGAQGMPVHDLAEKMYSENNRVSADAIIEVAKVQVNESVLQALQRLLNDRDPVFKKSGDYAVKQIIGYYSAKDPVFLQTNRHLQEIQRLSRDNRVAS